METQGLAGWLSPRQERGVSDCSFPGLHGSSGKASQKKRDLKIHCTYCAAGYWQAPWELQTNGACAAGLGYSDHDCRGREYTTVHCVTFLGSRMENRIENLLNIPGRARVIKIGAGLDTRSCRIGHNAVLAVSSQG